MKPRSVLPMKVARYGYILISLLFCGAGLTLLPLSTVSARQIGILFGVGMIFFGAVRLIGYFSRDLYRLAFQHDLQFGILLLALGVMVLLRCEDTVDFICAVFGVCMAGDGLFRVQTALDAKRFGIRLWWLTLVLALLTCLTGLVLTFRPVETLGAVTTLLGIALVMEGILNFNVAIWLVKIIDHQHPDVIGAEYYEQQEEK